jgi:sulfonate dioxygenase
VGIIVTKLTTDKNCMGTSFLCALEVPECGGNTLYLNSMEAYDKLSESMKEFLGGLSAVHSGAGQAVLGVKSSHYRR